MTILFNQWGIMFSLRPGESCTVKYPGQGVMYSEVSWPGESCTVRHPGPGSHVQWSILARGVMYSEISWPGESCTVRYPRPGSHAQWGILARRVMYSEVSWPGESCTVKYPGPGSHAQWSILARGVMHSEVSWPGESCTVIRILAQGVMCSYLFTLFFHVNIADYQNLAVGCDSLVCVHITGDFNITHNITCGRHIHVDTGRYMYITNNIHIINHYNN